MVLTKYSQFLSPRKNHSYFFGKCERRQRESLNFLGKYKWCFERNWEFLVKTNSFYHKFSLCFPRKNNCFLQWKFCRNIMKIFVIFSIYLQTICHQKTGIFPMVFSPYSLGEYLTLPLVWLWTIWLTYAYHPIRILVVYNICVTVTVTVTPLLYI